MLRVSGGRGKVPRARLTGFGLGRMSADDIRQAGVVRVTKPATFVRNVPQVESPMDPAMGTIQRDMPCVTCGKKLPDCTGHFGYMDLPVPLVHPLFLRTIEQLLLSLCPVCSRLRLCDDECAEFERLQPAQRLDAVCAVAKTKRRCRHEDCAVHTPNSVTLRLDTVKETVSLRYAERKNLPAQSLRPLSHTDLSDFLGNIEPKLAEWLGVADPSSLMVRVLIVSPPLARPSFSTTEGARSRGHDDQTALLLRMLRLIDNYDKPGADREKVHREMQEMYSGMIRPSGRHSGVAGAASGTSSSLKRRNNTPIQSLTERCGSKKGWFRGMLGGHTIEHAGRATIVGDRHIALDQVVVPEHIWSRLGKMETVFAHNLKRLQSSIDAVRARPEGAPVQPGDPLFVITPQGRQLMIDVICSKDKEVRLDLPAGFKDGKPLVWQVFRCLRNDDLVVMNRQPSIHPASFSTHRVIVDPDPRNCVMRIHQCVTPPYNADFDGDEMNVHVVGDPAAVAELELMSVASRQISNKHLEVCIAPMHDGVAGLFMLTRTKVWLNANEVSWLLGNDVATKRCTGHQVVSALLPHTLNVREPGLVVKEGLLDEASILNGGKVKLLQKRTVHSVGSAQALVQTQKLHALGCRYAMMKGWGPGLDSLRDETFVPIRQFVAGCVASIDRIAADAHAALPMTAVKERAQVRAAVRQAARDAMKLGTMMVENGMSNLQTVNDAMIPIVSGAKASMTHAVQLSVTVGMQSTSFDIPTAAKPAVLSSHEDLSTLSMGGVTGCFLQGLDPTEMFWHVISGREGLVDTAHRTAEVGYTSRRVLQCMMDLVAGYDGGVRGSSSLIAVKFGGDGLDSASLQAVPLPWGERTCDGARALLTNPLTGEVLARATLPFHPTTLLARAHARPDGAAARRLLDDWCSDMVATFGDWETLAARVAVLLHCENVSGLDPAVVAEELGDWKKRWFKARVPAGHPCGMWASLMLSEPMMQMTMRTFHTAGTGGVSVTQGLPRLLELILARRKTACAVIEARMAADFDSEACAQAAACAVVCQSIEQLAERQHWYVTSASDVASRIGSWRQVLDAMVPEDFRCRLSDWVLVVGLCEDKVGAAGTSVVELAECVTESVGMSGLVLAVRNEIHVVMSAYHGDGSFASASALLHGKVLSVCRGMTGVTNAQAFARDGHWYVQMGGSGALGSVLMQPWVDARHVWCNDIGQVLAVLGVHAAYLTLCHELHAVLKGSLGHSIEHRYVQLLASQMLQSGSLLALDRHGMGKRENTGFLRKLMFERITDPLAEAAAHNVMDPCRNPAERIILSRPPLLGTHTPDLQVLPSKNEDPIIATSGLPPAQDMLVVVGGGTQRSGFAHFANGVSEEQVSSHCAMPALSIPSPTLHLLHAHAQPYQPTLLPNGAPASPTLGSPRVAAALPYRDDNDDPIVMTA